MRMGYEYLVFSFAPPDQMRFCFCSIDLGCSSKRVHSEREILVSLSHLCPFKQTTGKQQYLVSNAILELHYHS